MKLKATKDRVVICLGANYWGSGKTEKAAIESWRRANGTLALEDRGQKEVEVAIIDAPASFEIDEIDGTVRRHEKSPPSSLIAKRTLRY